MRAIFKRLKLNFKFNFQYRDKFFLIFFFIFSFVYVLFFNSPNSIAQIQNKVPSTQIAPPDLQDPPKTSLELESKEKNNTEDDKKILYLTPTIGIEHTEDLKNLIEDLPADIETKGDFTNFADVAFDKETSILKITPKSVGVSSITVHDKKSGKLLYEFRLDIKRSNLDKVAREIRSLLGDIEGIQIKILNNKVFVDGQILLPRDLLRIGNVVMQYPDSAVSLVTLSPLAQKKIAEIIERDINNPEINVRAVNEKFILEGIANSDSEKARAEYIARTYLPDIALDAAVDKYVKKARSGVGTIVNLITIRESAPPPPKKMIQLVIHYVELSKDYTNSFEFKWAPQLTDNSQLQFGQARGTTSTFSSITGIIDSFLPKLDWLKTHNHARVLESTSLIIEEGKRGELKSTSSIPYSVTQAGGVQGTQKEEVGISSAILPTLVSPNSDSIMLDMKFEISQFLGYNPAGPLTSSNNVHTNVTVRSGQSAAIAGLISNTNTTGYNSPGNEGKPLFRLLNSKAFQRKQSQFVVFVTPIIKSSASSGVEKVKKKFRLRD